MRPPGRARTNTPERAGPPDHNCARKHNDHFDMVDDFLVGAGAPLLGPALLSFDALKRIINLKGLEARVVDNRQGLVWPCG